MRDVRAQQLDLATAAWGAHPDDPGAEVPDDPEDDATVRRGWSPVDLGPYLRGEITQPEPGTGLARSDGLRLLYPGLEHCIIGETESGKSWFALACTAAELAVGHHVVYLHFEEASPSGTLERLQALGVTTSQLLAQFHFVGPEDSGGDLDRLAELVEPAPSLVILDGVNEALSLLGMKDDADGIATYRRKLVKPFTRLGAATLACDHVVKNPEARAMSRGPSGAGHRINGLTGVLIDLHNSEPFGRGRRGRSRVEVTKDRHGFLRCHGRPAGPGRTYMGELVVDDTEARSPDLELTFYAPRSEDKATEEVAAAPSDAERVLAAIQAQPGGQVSTITALRALVREDGNMGNEKVQDAVALLVLRGQIEPVESKGKATPYRVVHRPQAPAEVSSAASSGASSPLREGTADDAPPEWSRTTADHAGPSDDA